MEKQKRRLSVLISGASAGLGKIMAFYLQNAGFRVFAGVRKRNDLQKWEKLKKPDIIPLLLDVTSSRSVQQAVRLISRFLSHDSLWALINNAGISIPGPLEFLPLSVIRKQFEVNLFGPVRMVQEFLPFLRKSRGRIVNIGSISGKIAAPFIGPYAASKSALRLFSDTLRMELRPWGIRVILIEPGSLSTSMWKKTGANAERIMQGLSSRAKMLYRDALLRSNQSRKQLGSGGSAPEMVARIVVRALTARDPRTRYLCGRDAQILDLVMKFLPDTIRDRVILRFLRLHHNMIDLRDQP